MDPPVADGGRGGSSRPVEPTSHDAAPDRVCDLRQSRKLGPARIGPILGLPASTVHRILLRHGLNRLARLDRPTGEPIRRYEHARPGDLVHVDIKKLGNIPDGGGWRTLGRTAGDRNRQATTTERKSCTPVIGYSYIHSAVDDHSRLACSEVLPDERQHTAIAFWQRANAFFAGHGITVERVLTDNGACYKSKLFTQNLTAAGIRQEDPALPAADHRQGRTFQPHLCRLSCVAA
ncbi:hypothetical protein SUDANB37_00014 [Streptomyces sp. enrichment culture]